MLNLTHVLPVALFALSTVGTPGPNNVMLIASGARFGYRRTLRHILGVIGGSATIYIAVAAGLGSLFRAWPLLQWSLRLTGAGYLLYLAWRIASAPPPDLSRPERVHPMTFSQAALFQYANPKVWVMGFTLAAAFLPSGPGLWMNTALLVAIMSVVGFPCLSFWTLFGTLIARWLHSSRAWALFNAGMGTLTAACVGFILLD